MQIKSRKLRANLTISGIPEMPDKNCTQLAHNFFKDTMKIKKRINVADAYRIGQGPNRTMVVKLIDPTQKALIFPEIHNLIGVKNAQGKTNYVADQLPE